MNSSRIAQAADGKRLMNSEKKFGHNFEPFLLIKSSRDPLYPLMTVSDLLT
jgi:hypothetical protein